MSNLEWWLFNFKGICLIGQLYAHKYLFSLNSQGL